MRVPPRPLARSGRENFKKRDPPNPGEIGKVDAEIEIPYYPYLVAPRIFALQNSDGRAGGHDVSLRLDGQRLVADGRCRSRLDRPRSDARPKRRRRFDGQRRRIKGVGEPLIAPGGGKACRQASANRTRGVLRNVRQAIGGERGARPRPPNTAGAVYIFARRNAASPILANGTVCDLNRPHSIGRLPFPAVGPACRAGLWPSVPLGKRDLRDESRPPTARQAKVPPGRRDLHDENRPPTARQAEVPPGRRDLRDESRPPTARQAEAPPGRRDLRDESRPPTARQAKPARAGGTYATRAGRRLRGRPSPARQAGPT